VSEGGGRSCCLRSTKSRVLTGPTGPVELRRPRGRMDPPVGTPEWASAIVPRYQRRRRQVNETVVATCLAGGNMRRSRGALAPLLQAAPLSKSAVSRIVGTLTAALDAWQTRPLADVDVVYLYLDAIALRVRSGGEGGGPARPRRRGRPGRRPEATAAAGALPWRIVRGVEGQSRRSRHAWPPGAPAVHCRWSGSTCESRPDVHPTEGISRHDRADDRFSCGNARCVIGSSPLARVLMLLCRHRKGRFGFSTRLGTLPG
jgi:Transposase, Mutator family